MPRLERGLASLLRVYRVCLQLVGDQGSARVVAKIAAFSQAMGVLSEWRVQEGGTRTHRRYHVSRLPRPCRSSQGERVLQIVCGQVQHQLDTEWEAAQRDLCEGCPGARPRPPLHVTLAGTVTIADRVDIHAMHLDRYRGVCFNTAGFLATWLGVAPWHGCHLNLGLGHR